MSQSGTNSRFIWTTGVKDKSLSKTIFPSIGISIIRLRSACLYNWNSYADKIHNGMNDLPSGSFKE